MSKGSLECFSLQYRSFARLSSCPSAASTAAGITTKSSLRALSDVRAIHYGDTATQLSLVAEGTVYTARVLSRSDLDRQIVRSSTCEISIPELELTLPATNRGQMTTIEGLVRDIYRDLSTDQPLRRVHDPTGYEKVRTLLEKMKEMLGDEDEDEVDQRATTQSTSGVYVDKPMPSFTVRLNDPAGNSFIEFVDSMADPKWNLRTYQRTLQQNVDLNLINPDEVQVSTIQGMSVEDVLKGDVPVKEVAEQKGDEEDEKSSGDPPPITSDEVFVFPGPCSSCGHHINTLMKKVNIPHFKVSVFMDQSECELYCPERT